MKFSGRYSDEDAMNVETDKYDKRKIKVYCPYCHEESEVNHENE